MHKAINSLCNRGLLPFSSKARTYSLSRLSAAYIQKCLLYSYMEGDVKSHEKPGGGLILYGEFVTFEEFYF